MTNIQFYFAVGILIIYVAVTEGLRCLQCDGVSSPHDCTTVANCSDGHHCFTDFYVTEQGFVYYDVGCRSDKICNALYGKRKREMAHQRRQYENLHLCEECCDTDNCNREGCNDRAVTKINGTVCFNCPDVLHPEDCSKVVVCDDDEICSTTRVLTQMIQERNELGCQKKTICDHLEKEGNYHGYPSINSLLGKRQFSFPITECQYCCKDNFCNERECVKGKPQQTITPKSTTTPKPTKPTTKPTTPQPTTKPTKTTPKPTKPTTKTITTTPKPTKPTTKTTTPKPTTTTSKPTKPTTNRTTPKPTTKATTTTTPKPTKPTTKSTTVKPTTTTTKPQTTTPKPTTTTTIPECGPKAADIVFVLDSSESLTEADFDLEKEFVFNFTKKFKIGVDNVQFASITFGSLVRSDFQFNTYHNRNDLLNKIKSLQFMKSGTNTSYALKYVTDEVFKHSNGARSSASKIVVVITDGASFDKNETKKEADRLQQHAKVLSIGIGQTIDTEEVAYIASSKKALTVDNFDLLHTMGAYLMEIACPGSAHHKHHTSG